MGIYILTSDQEDKSKTLISIFQFSPEDSFRERVWLKTWMKMKVAVIRNKVMYAKPIFWNFKKAIQLFNFNTKRRNQESYMQTHTHKDFYQAVQCSYWLGAARQQNLMNNFKIYAIKFEELWKTVNDMKPWLTGCHLHRELWQILANTDSTGSLLYKIILQVVVFLTPGKWGYEVWCDEYLGGKRRG